MVIFDIVLYDITVVWKIMQSIIAEYRGSFLRDIADYWRYIFAFCRQERTMNRWDDNASAGK